MKDVFVDRFVKCNVSQGVVRLDFARVENIDHEKNEVSMSPSARLVLPLDSFMHFIDQAEQLREKILSQGPADVVSATIDEPKAKKSKPKAKAKKTAKSVH